MSDSLRHPGLQPTKGLRPGGFSGKNTRRSRHSLLRGVCPAQGLSLHLPRQILYRAGAWEAHVSARVGDSSLPLTLSLRVMPARTLVRGALSPSSSDRSRVNSISCLCFGQQTEHILLAEDFVHGEIKAWGSRGLQGS